VKRLFWLGVVTLTTMVLALLDLWLWPQIDLTHRIECIRAKARCKLDNMEDKDDGA
jgi:hypothetical protein